MINRQILILGPKTSVMTLGIKRSLEAVFITTIGTNIKRLRKLHDLNQTEFANKIGISQGSLSDLESGKSKPA